MPSTQPSRPIRIGLAGLGNVGSGVYRNLARNRDLLTARTGADLEVVRVVVRDPSKARAVEVPEGIVTTRLDDLVEDPKVDIVVELIGGTGAAYDLVEAALKAKKPVVTGNKALLAERGIELMALAERENVPLYCEAAVAGGIPIIKAVGEALVGNRIESIYGIINGTSNYILGRMQDAGLPFSEALREAQDLGYAEADPALDINGWDAAHKAIILAWLSYGRWPNPKDIHVEGIESIDPTDIAFARRLGYHIKLVGVVKPGAAGAVEVRVQPSLLPRRHVLAHINGVQNALAVRGDVVGETLYAGPGAGQDATSSSVIADLADVAHNISRGTSFDGFLPHGEFGPPVPLADTVSQYYVRLEVTDRPGTIAQITAVLGEREIGILSIIQPEPGQEGESPAPPAGSGTAPAEETATLVLTLHDAAYGNVTAALEEISGLSCTRNRSALYRIESL